MSVVTYNFPTRIRFGAGARTELVGAIEGLGKGRPAFVTDGGVSGLDWFQKLVKSTEAKLPTAVYDGVGGNPTGSQVMAGAKATKAHDADVIIAVGGGAALDVAKAIAVVHGHGGDVMDYAWGDGMAPISAAKVLPIIAIPSTAGTGSEVGRSAVISDDATHQKKIVFDASLLPRVVLADPEVTLGLPAHLTAATGFDALTHLVEAFLTDEHHPMCEGIALEGVRLVAGALETAVDSARKASKGEDVDASAHLAARSDMLDAAIMGAVAFQKELGVTHSCAHALSTVADLHHGLANAIMLPYALRYNAPIVPGKMLRLARIIDPKADDGQIFIDWIVTLRERLDIPADLSKVGVGPKDLGALVEIAVADGCHQYNPQPVSGADFRALFTEAFGDQIEGDAK